MDTLSNYFRKTKCHSRDDIALNLGPFSTEYFSMSLPEKVRSNIIEACRFKDMPPKPQNFVNLDRSRSEETCDLAAHEETEEFIIDDDSD